ncbi:uncharacterized protein LOC128855375 [Anastrepha ludens]|uniref:uncharacterized protein LOC128855375 n=1 Tax=Anastrepha ludens TaxID=28586 RepID=UPI0023AFE105|nr:uncharacterized protein LOC128855375 [Anastrepha ludens]
MAELIECKKSFLLHINGYLYYKHSGRIGETAYWNCRRKPECNARVTTYGGPHNIRVLKGLDESKHILHAPNPEEVEALRVMNRIKRKATENLEAPPAQILRTELRNVSPAVLAEMPNRINSRKSLSRERLKDFPSNPRTLRELQDIPGFYQNSLNGDKFLIYDSYENDEDSEFGRILVFATPENLRQLFRSILWFADGTFKTAPSIFFQVFAILGAVTQPDSRGKPQTIGLPFVYALLENKEQKVYEKVFSVVLQEAERLGIDISLPIKVMTDFELAIINAVKIVIGEDKARCCFFHLCQNMYRHIQSEGLQKMYCDPEDRSVKVATHMICALAFVPHQNIAREFETLKNEIPKEMRPISKYFDATYVRGKPAKGRRKQVHPRYAPDLWCQYDAVIQQTARTNNISEGWHNRLQVVIGKDHPSFYIFLSELQKEQSDTEIMMRQLQSGQQVKKNKYSKRLKHEQRIFNIVSKYHEYVDNNDIVTYLKTLGYYIRM